VSVCVCVCVCVSVCECVCVSKCVSVSQCDFETSTMRQFRTELDRCVTKISPPLLQIS